MEGVGIAIIVLWVFWGGLQLHRHVYDADWFKAKHTELIQLDKTINDKESICNEWECRKEIVKLRKELKLKSSIYNAKARTTEDNLLSDHELPESLEW
jgi:hypothetical protein